MKSIKLWFRMWLAKYNNEKHEKITSDARHPTIPQNTKEKADFFKDYYSLVAESARLKLIEAMFGLNLFALFDNKDIVLESEIIEKLRLEPLRAQKWLHLLSYEQFLIKTTVNNHPAYKLPDGFKQYLLHQEGWLTMLYFMGSWIEVSKVNLTNLLQVGTPALSYSWPPKTKDEAACLEQWMTDTSLWTINCLFDQINFKNINNLLDVGGGDGTIACALAVAHPHLNITVYNLPASAELARENIESQGLSHRINVIDGDFLEDEAFPLGFDLILFARIMWDWGEKTNRRLVKMAYQALQKNALVAICEVFKDDDNDFCLSLEYRHLFYDSFDARLMKTSEEYRLMLEQTGFTTLPRRLDTASSMSVLMAKK